MGHCDDEAEGKEEEDCATQKKLTAQLSSSPHCHAVSHQSEEELKVGRINLMRPSEVKERERETTARQRVYGEDGMGRERWETWSIEGNKRTKAEDMLYKAWENKTKKIYLDQLCQMVQW